jgi:hypothetical protein
LPYEDVADLAGVDFEASEEVLELEAADFDAEEEVDLDVSRETSALRS